MRHAKTYAIGLMTAALLASAPATEAKTLTKKTVLKCITDVGYDTSKAGNKTRVQSPGGRIVGNIQFFGSNAAAKKFARQLAVPHRAGPRAVVIWFASAKGSDKTVVGSCVAYGK